MLELLASLPLSDIHVLFVFVTLALVVTADGHGFLWLIGKLEVLPRPRMELLHKLIWGGLSVIITTGAIMFLFYQDYLVTVTAFWIKMGFVLALLINAFFIGKLAHKSYSRPFVLLTHDERIPLIISGAVSTVAWVGAFTAAQFLGL